MMFLTRLGDITTDDLFGGIMVFMAVCAVLWGIVFVMKKKDDARNETEPLQTRAARVIEKQQIPAGQVVIGSIWAVFELENGERIRLYVKEHSSVYCGDKGMLTWQGNRAVSFERSK